MKNIVAKLKAGTKRALIIGDIMLDEYVFGTVARISPEAPVPVLKKNHMEWSLGGAANVAHNCQNIGFDVSLIGVVGDDLAGKKIQHLLDESHLCKDGLVVCSDRKTTSKQRLMAENHQLMRLDEEDAGSLTYATKFALLEKIKGLIPKADVILLSDYAKGVLDHDAVASIIQLAKKAGIPCCVDPKGPSFDKYMGATYLKPNLKEFEQMAQYFSCDKNDDLIVKARAICKCLNLEGMIITQGNRGISFVSQVAYVHSHALEQEVFDLTGAGDTVFAFFVRAYLEGLSMKDCLRVANRAAAVAISHVKTYAVTIDELIDREIETSEKIITDWAELKVELDFRRIEGKRVVFTNGCFDLLHKGHISLLNEAKRRGDILLVALNTDESIKILKGSSRPIKPFEERAEVMASIGVVDFVTSFGQETPRELIKFLRPDVLVKGGDYKAQDVVGYDTLVSYGGKVEIVEFVPGHSTTKFLSEDIS